MQSNTPAALRELHRARTTIKKLSAEKQVLVRRQRELDAEFEKHQMQVDEATGAEDDAFTSYAQSCLQDLARTVYTCMPQELRDEVYSYLWYGTDTKRTLQLYAAYGFAHKKGKSDWELPQFALPAYMGAAMADEAISYLYRDVFSDYARAVNMLFLDKFMTHDVFGRNFRAIDWITTLRIDWRGGNDSRTEKHAVQAALETLSEHTFPSPIAVEVELSGYSRLEGPRSSIVDKLERFRSTYVALIGKGYAVTIKEAHWKMDVADYYTMSAEAWYKKTDAMVEGTSSGSMS